MKSKIINTLIIVITLLSINIIPCHAEVKTYNRNELENYGVKKNITITDGIKNSILNTKAVDSEDKIYDFSDVLTDEEENKLRDRMRNFTEKYNMETVILTDNVPYSYDGKNEQFATDFYDYNDFGLNYDKYDGVILFRNTYETNPYFDAYAYGNAQLYFYKTRLSDILDDIYNDIHSGNYYEAFNKYLDDLEMYYSKGKLENYVVDNNGYLKEIKHYKAPILLIVLGSGVITAIIMGIMISKNKMIRKATTATEYLDKNSLKVTTKEDIFVTTHTTSYTESDSSSSGGGGHSSSSGSSGIGHSSGGGRHG